MNTKQATTPQRKPYNKRRYSLFPDPLAKSMSSPVANILRKRGFSHEAILHYWPQAAGPTLSQHARPVRLSTSKGKHAVRQLIVKTNGAYSTILAHEAERILQQLTHYLGYRPAERIVIVQ